MDTFDLDGVNLEQAQEANFINQPDLGFRIDKWGTGKDQMNILLITGHSGSGKTTLARELAKKYEATVVSLDWFDFYVTYPRRSSDPEYPAWKFFTDCITKTGNTTDPLTLNFTERCKLFCDSFEIFRKACEKDRSRLFIAEGIQVINLMGNSIIPQELPVICKGTSAAVSALRRKARDGSVRDNDGRPTPALKLIIEWMGIEKRNQRFMARMNATGQATVVNL